MARVIDLQQAVAASMDESRTIGYLVAAFAGLALLLSAVGLYGVVAYTASQRVREMGIRKALGAKSDSLQWLILGRGLGIAVTGIVVGFGVSYALGSALESLLELGGDPCRNPGVRDPSRPRTCPGSGPRVRLAA